MSKVWDISPEGVEEIRSLEKNVEGCMGRLEQAWKELTGAVVEHGEDLGPYREPLESALDAMNRLNEVSRDSLERLTNRLDQFAAKIEEELAKGEL